MDEKIITAILAKKGNPCTFYLADANAKEEIVHSSSIIIQATLISAFLEGSKVKLDLVSGSPGSKEIKRVNAFYAADAPKIKLYGNYFVNRLATQRFEGEDDHLEVFLSNTDPNKDTEYNVYDQLMIQLLQAAFITGDRYTEPSKLNIQIKFDGDSIDTVCMGEEKL